MNNTWKLDDGRSIELLTVKELRALPGDTRIVSINGKERLVEAEGMEPPDDDTRYGYSAWGTLPYDPLNFTPAVASQPATVTAEEQGSRNTTAQESNDSRLDALAQDWESEAERHYGLAIEAESDGTAHGHFQVAATLRRCVLRLKESASNGKLNHI